MGLRDPVRRSTLADANKALDSRISAELAQRLITQARRLYVNEDLGFNLANTVCALDATTIDRCLAVFPCAHFRTTKAAVKMHTVSDLRGNIPSFIHGTGCLIWARSDLCEQRPATVPNRDRVPRRTRRRELTLCSPG